MTVHLALLAILCYQLLDVNVHVHKLSRDQEVAFYKVLFGESFETDDTFINRQSDYYKVDDLLDQTVASLVWYQSLSMKRIREDVAFWRNLPD